MTEQEKRNELIADVVERFVFHSNYETDNPVVAKIAAQMRELDITLMWMLTQ